MEGVLQAVRDMAAAAAHTTSRHPPAARPGLSGSNSSRAKARGSSSSGDGGSSTAVAATAVADAADVARVEVLLAQLCGEEADGTAAVQQQQRQRRQQGRTLARLPAAVGSSAQAAAGAAVGSAAGSMGGLLAGEAAANRARKEFVEVSECHSLLAAGVAKWDVGWVCGCCIARDAASCKRNDMQSRAELSQGAATRSDASCVRCGRCRWLMHIQD